MKKRLFSLVLALALCMGLMVPASAAGLEDFYETFINDYKEIYLERSTPSGGKVGEYFGGYTGLKDKIGNVVIKPEYLRLSMTGDVLIATKQSGNWYTTGIIDVNGNVLVPFQYYKISSIFWMYQTDHTGYWEVTDSNTCLTGILGPNYSMIVPTMYSDVKILSRDDGYFLVSNTHNADRSNSFDLSKGFLDNQWGVYDRLGNFIIPCEYDDISYLGDGLFSVRKNELVGVLNSQGETILPLEYAAPYNNNIFRYKNAFTVHKFVSTEYQKRAAAGETCPQLGELWTTAGVVDINNNILVDFAKYQTITVDNSGTFSCGRWTGGYTTAQYQISGGPTRYANEYEYDYVRYDNLDVSEVLSTPPAPTIPPTNNFTDVKASDYFAEAVQWAVEKDITSGTSKATFSPGATCSKAQILTFLWRANGSPDPTATNPFTDVKTSDYFYKAALWAAENGSVSGSTFGANTDCTRAMTMEYMWKAAGSPAASYNGKFNDVPASADYAQAVAWAVEQKITSGTGSSNFFPAATCTRGQIVTFLHRAMGK